MATVGMNLEGPSYWSKSYPFIDRMKTASDWNVTGPATEPLVLNADGYPVKTPAGTHGLQLIVGVDPQALDTPDRYVLTWDGDPDFYVGLVQGNIVSRGDHKMVIELVQGQTQLDMRVGFHDGTTLSNMHLVREDQVALFQQGEIFNPEFLEKVSPFDTLRMMDWGKTNTANIAVTWANRTTPNDFSWAARDESVPLEVMVALANKTHENLWYNIPFQADDTFVQNAVQYIKNNLDPSLKVSIEYSNEVWNWSFPAATLAAQRGVAMGFDPNGGPQIAYYGYRAAQVAQVARAAFGDDPTNRLHNVLSTQTGWTGLETYNILPAVMKVGDPKVLFDDYAVTTYFGYSFGSTDPADKATMLQWARSGEAGLSAAFHELEFGGSLKTDSSLVWLANTLAYQANIANKYGWNMVAYEGGMHMIGVATGNTQEDTDLATLIFTMLKDPRMGDIYTKMVDVFAKAGGTELTAFNEAGPFWGALETIYDDHSARYDALVAAAQAGKQSSQTIGSLGNDTLSGTAGADTMIGYGGNDYYIVNSAGDRITEVAGGGIDEVATTLASYTLPEFVENLTFVGSGNFTGGGNELANLLIGGVGNDTLSGAAGADTLVGGAGNDRLDGGTGADALVGGAGDDVYVVDDSGDVVVEALDQGTDRVLASATYTLGANLEGLTLTGTGAIDGTGNGLGNEIYGNDAANRLYGLAGNDVLSGGGGNDVIDGGDGADVLDGGAGSDTLIGGAGNDTLMGLGVDRMLGGAGDDTYYVDDANDVVIELAGEGRDLIRSTIDYTLPAEVERLWLTGSAAKGVGNALDNVLTYTGSRAVTLTGLEGNDTLEGGSGADTLDGGIGDDRLTGGAGNDVLIGGAGKDMLSGGAGADRFVIRPGDTGATSSTADQILGFSHAEGDRIDLSAFDAIPGGADDPFRFVGSANFTHTAGELRFVASADTMTVFGDTDGDGVADFSLLVSTSVPLVSSDFVL